MPFPNIIKEPLTEQRSSKEQLTQEHLNIQKLAKKAVHKVFVTYIVEKPAAKQHLIDNGLKEDQVSIYFISWPYPLPRKQDLPCSNTRFYAT